MPAPIHSLLADELEISEQNAEKLLSAMLREVQKRARREGVRLPNLGKFSEREGELTFEPNESHARAVNHRFEGLDTEDLRGAPGGQERESQESSGPSTITLGYQDSDWSPLDTAEADEETDPASSAESPDDQGADTEEFQAPDSPRESPSSAAPEAPASEQASDSPPTHEMDSPAEREPSPGESPEASPPEHDTPQEAPPEKEAPPDQEETTDTEELYPLVEDVPGQESTPESEAEEVDPDAERDELSKIWNSDPEETEDADFEPHEAERSDVDPVEADDADEASGFSFSDEDAPDDATLSDIPTESTEPEAEEADLGATSTPEASPSSPDASEADSGAASEPSRSSSSSLPRMLVTLLVLLLLGGGAWYILGQRGLVPSPGRMLGLRGPAPTAESPASSPSDGAGTQRDAGTDSQGTSAQDASSSSETTEEAPADAPQSITPSAGGWTIVVASRRNQAGAASLIDTYRQRFSDRPLPVDVVQGTVDNTTRYRVGIGQFQSRIEAQTFLDANSAALPDGAWLLELE